MRTPRKSVCVFCASSNDVDRLYFDTARALGQGLAEEGWNLVYGGGKLGLMGALADAARSHGGRVCGVIPEFMVHEGRGHEACDEFIVTSNMRERKAIMESRADAFVALPGGFGTLEELLEIVTLKLLRLHSKPVVIVNANGYYDPLIAVFDHFSAQHFAAIDHRTLYQLAGSVADAIEYVKKSLGHTEIPARRPR